VSSGQPIPYAEALPVAEELRTLLAPACEQITIAGSLRRRKDLVSDIELVAEPRYRQEPSGLWGDTTPVDLLEERIAELALLPRPVTLHRADGSEEVQTRDGRSYKALVYAGIPVDLFAIHGSDFGVILTIRTGPADFSHRLVTECQRYFRQVRGGKLYVHGKYVPCPTERDFLSAVGMPWLEPEERAPERVKLMMGGLP
jgi:DNA polymerase/3'-5' exonuclease PolX